MRHAHSLPARKQRWSGGFAVHRPSCIILPGDHVTVIAKPNVQKLAEVLTTCLQSAEADK